MTAGRSLSAAEKAQGFRLRWLRDQGQELLGSLPFAEWRLGRALEGALEKGVREGLWFDVPAAFSEAVLARNLVVPVDPRRVSSWLLSQADIGGAQLRPRDHFLGGGDWSPLIRDVADSELDLEAHEIFDSKGAIRATASFQSLLRRLNESGGRLFHNGVWIRRESELTDYFIRQWGLAESIRTRGYLNLDAAQRGFAARGRFLEGREHEAGVAIGANGAFLRFRGGFHRFAYARALGLEAIPMAVRLVHGDWLRREMAETRRGALDALLAGLARIGVK